MLRRPSLIVWLMSVCLLSAWQPLLAQEIKGGQKDDVKEKIAQLRQEAKTKNWTFEVGYSKAADQPLAKLAGTRVPEGLNVAKVAANVNERGAGWLSADVRARDAFAKTHPGVLPGLKVEPRVQHATYARKSAFDWRTYNKVTPVPDQLNCGSCWDFTAIGAFECNYLIRNNVTIDAAEQQILDCSGAGNCDGGWWMGAFDYLIKHGGSPETAYPYQAKQGACKAVTSPYKAVSWGFVAKDGAIPSVDAMKSALCQHGPLAVAVNATTAFHYYKGGVFNEHASGAINHGILLVGWDDNKGKNGAWLIRNSWNTGWGEKGYMWIEYDCNRIGDHAAWVEAQSTHYDVMILLVNDYKVQQNQEVVAPIYLIHPTKVKNMNWTLRYDSNVAVLVEPKVVQGNLPLTLFEANPRENDLVRMGFAQTEPITADGTVAVLRFKAVGTPGSKTPLTLDVTKVNDHEGVALPIKLIYGSIEIVKDSKNIPHGSCTGCEKLGIEDARCALQMSVGNRTVSLNMDMDNDGEVTSRDAAIILQKVLDQTRTGQ
jgi:cathepsin L